MHSGHHDAARFDFPIVKDYDGNQTIQFQSVPLGNGTGAIYMPVEPTILDCWLNISELHIELDITPDASSIDSANMPVISEVFDLPVGALMTLDFEGNQTLTESSFTRADAYKGLCLSRIEYEASGSRAVGGEAWSTEFYSTSLSVEIHHGKWGFHQDQGKWLTHFVLSFYDELSTDFPPYDQEFVIDTPNDPMTVGLPQGECPAGYEVISDTIVTNGLPEGSGGLWSYTCELADYMAPATKLTESDPDGAEEPGSYLAFPIKARKTEVAGLNVPAWYLGGSTLSLIITENDRHTVWF